MHARKQFHAPTISDPERRRRTSLSHGWPFAVATGLHLDPGTESATPAPGMADSGHFCRFSIGWLRKWRRLHRRRSSSPSNPGKGKRRSAREVAAGGCFCFRSERSSQAAEKNPLLPRGGGVDPLDLMSHVSPNSRLLMRYARLLLPICLVVLIVLTACRDDSTLLTDPGITEPGPVPVPPTLNFRSSGVEGYATRGELRSGFIYSGTASRSRSRTRSTKAWPSGKATSSSASPGRSPRRPPNWRRRRSIECRGSWSTTTGAIAGRVA